MFKRFKVLVIAALGVALLGVAFAGTAQAEQCSPDGKICLVTESSPSQPILANATLQFRVTAEAHYFSVSGSRDERLVGPASDGMNLWEASMSPNHPEGQVTVSAYAAGAELSTPATHSFTVFTIGLSADERIIIRRNKKRVVAIYQYLARTALTAELTMNLNQHVNKDKPLTISYRRNFLTAGPGWQTLKVVFPRKLIREKCKPYLRCRMFVLGRSWVQNNQGSTADLQTVGTAWVQDKRKLCRKLRKKKYKRAYRKHCVFNKRTTTTKRHARS